MLGNAAALAADAPLGLILAMPCHRLPASAGSGGCITAGPSPPGVPGIRDLSPPIV